MTTVGQLQEFCPESESLTAYMYVERVELFPTANDIASQKKVPVFLRAVGGTTYGLLRNLLAPTSFKDKSFDEIVKVLKAHFQTKPVVKAERLHFHRRDQAPCTAAETVALYVAESSDAWLLLVISAIACTTRFGIVLSAGSEARLYRRASCRKRSWTLLVR